MLLLTDLTVLQLKDFDPRQGALCQTSSGCSAQVEGQQQSRKHTYHQENWWHSQGMCILLANCHVFSPSFLFSALAPGWLACLLEI